MPQPGISGKSQSNSLQNAQFVPPTKNVTGR